MSQRIITIAAVAFVVGVSGYAAFLAAKAPAEAQHVSAHRQPVWIAATWPFPIDQWGQGWAFQCKAADCGIDVSLYLRPKIGFCNCQTGVADDQELDRVSDLDLVASEKTPHGSGRPITVHWMKGRSRGYIVDAPSPDAPSEIPPAKAVLSLAFNSRCDVIVATVVAGDAPAAQEQAVLDFLNGDAMRQWAEGVLGTPPGPPGGRS